MWSLKPTAAPALEPVTTAEAKTHARIDTGADDAMVGNLIIAARQWAEEFTRRAFITQTWELRMDGFPPTDPSPIYRRTDEIIIPRPPLQSVTSIAYTDGNGAAQTWSSTKYQKDINLEPARIRPTEAEDWPDTQAATYATVVVTFVAGYGTAASTVPEAIKTAIKMLVEHWYEHRGVMTDTRFVKVPMAVESLLAKYRIWLL